MEVYSLNKYKQKKNNNKIKPIIIIIIIIIIILLGFLFNQIFKIKNVYIKGNKFYSEKQIVTFLNLDKYNNTFIFFIMNSKNHKPLPFVDKIDIKMLSFNDIKVEVCEKQVIGCIKYMGEYLYFNKNGILVESLSEQIQGIPLVNGLKYSELVLYKSIDENNNNDFKDLLKIVQNLNKNKININSININGNEFVLIKNKLEIILGNSENLNEKLNEIQGILPKIENEKGKLKQLSNGFYLEKDV